MGEAKRRGTHEQRAAEAKAKRLAKEAEDMARMRLSLQARKEAMRAFVMTGGTSRRANSALIRAALMAAQAVDA